MAGVAIGGRLILRYGKKLVSRPAISRLEQRVFLFSASLVFLTYLLNSLSTPTARLGIAHQTPGLITES